jgi:hypothetical protein
MAGVRYDYFAAARGFVCQWVRMSALLLLCAAWLGPAVLLAQTTGANDLQSATPPEEATSSQEQSTTDPFSGLEVPGEEGVCPPPSTQEKIMIGVGALALAVVCFFLLVRLMERYYIQRDRSATMGRHLGFSLTIFLSALGLLALVYLITGCLHPEFLLWLVFCGALWFIHLVYTLIAVRGN